MQRRGTPVPCCGLGKIFAGMKVLDDSGDYSKRRAKLFWFSSGLLWLHLIATSAAAAQSYAVTGEVREVQFPARALVVKHDAVPGYMPPMTMSFNLARGVGIPAVDAGDRIRFRLNVTDDESWIDNIVRMQAGRGAPLESAAAEPPGQAPKAFNIGQLPELHLTNEFGEPINLKNLQGSAFAFTFFFTRCPVPEYCPRLSRNFQTASHVLKSESAVPSNWHLFSISFDPLDTPAVLRQYGRSYNYDSNHWSFLTGPPAEIGRLARGFGVKLTQERGSYSHGFATAVFGTNGDLRAFWPIGGNTSTNLIRELQAAMRY